MDREDGARVPPVALNINDNKGVKVPSSRRGTKSLFEKLDRMEQNLQASTQ